MYMYICICTWLISLYVSVCLYVYYIGYVKYVPAGCAGRHSMASLGLSTVERKREGGFRLVSLYYPLSPGGS